MDASMGGTLGGKTEQDTLPHLLLEGPDYYYLGVGVGWPGGGGGCH